MNDKLLIEEIRANPERYGLTGRYYPTVMLLNGIDVAQSRGFFRGFAEWLCVQRQELSSCGWYTEIFREAVPEVDPSDWRGPLTPEQDQRALDLMFTRVLEFLTVRNNREALLRMYGDFRTLRGR
ncbi:hypothetical protein ACFYPN_24780 [Streptomyces sp. NPDC005576]|uniref:hypothetical protein n=1 Tax=unclassified Streptomyces TaxID=2593676 RepID=UPI0033FF9E74